MPLRIHLTGGSGSGTTTLGRALAQRYAIPLVDSDDLFWLKTDPPFTTKNPLRETQLAAALQEENWVLSGSAVGWGDFLKPRFTHVLFLSLDPAERLARLRSRESARYGERILPEGDMYQLHLEFLAWAAGYDDPNFKQRSRALHDKWLRDLPCPVLRLEGTLSTAEQLLRFEKSLAPLPFEIVSCTGGALADPFYESLGRTARARPGDIFFTALSHGDVIGCVRYCEEEGTRMLRSMLVAEHARGKGVGAALLEAYENALHTGGPVYCVPFAHLESFYARIGFRRVNDGPAFLLERMRSYREKGQNVILMIRD